MGCVTSFLILAHVLSPFMRVLGSFMENPATNLLKQQPYRKRLRVGDVFKLMYPESRCFLGQIISLEAEAGGFKDCILISIFAQEAEFPYDIQSLSSYEFLLAPLYMNKLGFSRGYMPVIDNKPIIEVSTKYCYFQFSRKRYLDSNGEKIDKPQGLIGDWGLSNYLVMDDLISEKLGLERCSS